MQPFSIWKSKAKDAAVRRLASRVVRIDRLIRVARADEEGCGEARGPDTSGGAELEWLAAAAERLKVADSKPKPLLMGRHLVERGMEPSPLFRKILAKAYDAQLDGAFSDLSGALAWLDASGAAKSAAGSRADGNGTKGRKH